MKSCPNCSAENADTGRFCTRCGTPLSWGDADVPAATTPMPLAGVGDKAPAPAEATSFSAGFPSDPPVASAPPSLPPQAFADGPFGQVPAASSRRKVWAAAVVLAIVAVAGLYAWNQSASSAAPAASVAVPPAESLIDSVETIVEDPPQPSAARLMELLEAPAPAASQPPAVAASASSVAPVVVPPVVASAVAASPAVNGSAPVTVPLGARPGGAAGAAARSPAAASAPRKPPAPLVVFPAASPPAPPPSAPPKPAVSGPTSPTQACSGRNLLLQTLCVSNQCRGGQFRNHPECVQLREEERLRDERLRNGGNG